MIGKIINKILIYLFYNNFIINFFLLFFSVFNIFLTLKLEKMTVCIIKLKSSNDQLEKKFLELADELNTKNLYEIVVDADSNFLELETLFYLIPCVLALSSFWFTARYVPKSIKKGFIIWCVSSLPWLFK